VLPDFSFSFFPVQFCASLAEVFSVGAPKSVGRPDSRALCSDFPLAWIGSAARLALFVRGECLPLFFLLSGFSLVLDSGAKAARLGYSSCSFLRASVLGQAELRFYLLALWFQSRLDFCFEFLCVEWL
jgi:hypothetical protein